MLIDQGHGFKILKNNHARSKQGPYSEKTDKVKFDSIDESKSKLGNKILFQLANP